MQLVLREALLTRQAGRTLAFAAAAAWVVLTAWPGSLGNPATSVAWLDVVTLLLALAGLPLLTRWWLGPASGRTARVLRYGGYTAVLVLTVAKASVEHVGYNPAEAAHLRSVNGAMVPAQTGMIYIWVVESLFLLVMAVYVTPAPDPPAGEGLADDPIILSVNGSSTVLSSV